MVEGYWRPAYHKALVKPCIAWLQAHPKVAPNVVTIVGGCIGLLTIPLVYFHYSILAVCALLLSGYCDSLDGALARALDRTSIFGTMLDISLDRVVEAAVIIALFLFAPQTRGLLCLLMLSSVLFCVTTFLVTAIFSENNSHKSFYYSPGLMERPEAFGFFIAMLLLPKYFIWLSGLFIVLVCYTALQRIWQFYFQVRVLDAS